MNAAPTIERAEGSLAGTDLAALSSALADAIGELETSADGDRGWLRRGLAAQARLAVVVGDRVRAAQAVGRLDALSRGGQDRWFAATTRLLECELLVLDGFAARGARRLDAVARWLAARPEAPAGLVVAVAQARVLAQLAAGNVAALGPAATALATWEPASPLVALARGVVAEHDGRVEAAVREYQLATGGGPVCALEAHLALARLAAGRDPAAASQHLGAGATLGGGGAPRVLAARARAELAAGRYAQAVALADRLERVADADALLACAEVACAAGAASARARITLLGLWAAEHGASALEAQAHLLAARIASDPVERATSIRLARELAVELGDRLLALRTRLEQAMLELDLDQPQAALATALELELAARGLGRDDLIAGAGLVRGLAGKRLGADDADEQLARAGALAVAQGQLTVAARALDGLGRGVEAEALRIEAGIAGPGADTMATGS